MKLEVKFGRKDEPAVALRRADDLIAVRTRSRRSLRAGAVASPGRAEIADGQLVLAFPDAGVEIYRIPTGTGSATVSSRKLALRRLPDVRFAGSVLVDEGGEPVVYTENLFVKFADDQDRDACRAVLREAGLVVKEELGFATNALFAAAPEGTGTAIFARAGQLLGRDDVEYCHPEVVRRRRGKAIAAAQWHLKPTTVNGILVNASANVEPAHAVTRGEGVTIAVIDDGIDIDHPELAVPGKLVAPRDATRQTADPRPQNDDPEYGDHHGTACAGVACAAGRFGASGVAPAARLLPIRLASALGSVREAQAFAWAVDHGADVISCSWGPDDGPWWIPGHAATPWPLPASTRLALDYATDRGRGGKGCIVLFAAGNGNESVDQDGYASYPRVIAVAACNDRGKRSVYSDFGNAVWCAFPSNDLGHPGLSLEPLTPGIWTTDRRGALGYNPGDADSGDSAGNYTNDFGGTSSACPGAAGVAALALSVNPGLRWQDVRDLLRRACDRIDPQDGQYDAQGKSPFYGHGRLNAATAVALAAPADSESVTISRTQSLLLPDLQTVKATLEVAEAATLRELAVQVELRHTWIGDLVLTLIPPASAGGPVVLHDRQGGATHDLRKTYDARSTPLLGAFAGKSAKGTWTLEIRDTAAEDSGRLLHFALQLAFAATPRAVLAPARALVEPRRVIRRSNVKAPGRATEAAKR